ncbi:MAG: DEAD/DEAH box helicase family protein [Acidobacteria bacterium]|nr:DEAD/DEAH box helicase family protein [Acidobacteriota bacterium]
MTAHVDFHFASVEELDGLGSATSRSNHNIAAISLLKQLEAVSCAPGDLTLHQQRTLAKYTGWGDSEVLKRAFPQGAYSWAEPCDELKGLLTQEETESLRASTLNAHYTRLDIIRAIYAAVEHLGLPSWGKLRVLEPAGGVGHFFGAMPASLAINSERAAVEPDSITARILERLYPATRVFACGFEAAQLPKEYFDLIISNVPFGDYAVHDPAIKDKRLRECIHDYFFVKSLSLLKPGGVLAFITSRYTLDKKKNAIRLHMAQQAELLAAARLPDNAFKRNAGTQVVTDVIILRKRLAPISSSEANALAWVETEMRLLCDDNMGETEMPVNRLFVANPDLVLGEMKLDRGMYARADLRVAPKHDDLSTALREKLIAQLPASPLTAPAAISSVAIQHSQAQPAKESSESEDGLIEDQRNSTARARASALFELYLQAKQVIRLQLDDADDEILAEAQCELNLRYERVRRRYGAINHPRTTRGLDTQNPILPFLRALEEPNANGGWRKAPFFHTRTIRPLRQSTTADNPKDALLQCLNELGRVDPDFIAGRCGVSRAETIAALEGLIYETHDGRYVTAEEYLSGNVRLKLREAEAAAKLNTTFAGNVEALKGVVPPALGQEEISARLGSGWIPADVITDFIRELLPGYKGQAQYHEQLGAWTVANADHFTLQSVEATQTWGTGRRNAIQLIDDALNLRQPTVHDLIVIKGKEQPVINDAETTSAQAKLTEIRQRFAGWVWAGAKRAERLIEIYNERYNGLRERRYSGSHLQFPGMSRSFEPRPHQKDGVWRILQSRATLLGHCVGSGKTALSIIAARELKRLGLARKALVAVPNHLLVTQWQREALRLYPDLKILAPGKADLSRSQRGELMSRIATGDWDLILIPHPSFTMLPVRQATVARFIEREVDQLRAYLEELQTNDKDEVTKKSVKEIERAIRRLEAKLLNTQSDIARSSEATICWEELGVDALFVDEAHYFKNLYCPTKMTRVAGMPNTESQRAFDMFIKVRSVLESGGRVVFATGTPISNSIAECYVMMKYLQLELLEELGLQHFDAWAQMFTDTSQSVEMKPDGSGFRVHTRFNRFTNLPELAAIWRQVLDVKTAEQLQLPRPQIHGGGAQVIKSPKSPALDRIIQSLAKRAEAISKRWVSPEEDNMLRITTEGRKAALDPRLVDPAAPADSNGKISQVVRNLMRFYQESHGTHGVQLVFVDTNCPRTKAE